MTVTYVRATGFGALAAIGTALIIGVPSDVIPNPWFTRQIAVDGADVLVLVVLSLLTGALAMTYALASGASGWFASIQPILGVAAIALSALALVVRIRAIRNGTCQLTDAESPRTSW